MKKFILIFLFSLNSIFSQSGQVFYEAISKKYPETKENKADVYITELENTKILLELKFNNTVSYFSNANLKKGDEFNLGEEGLSILIGYEELYYNLKDKLLFSDYGEFLIKTPSNHNWNILSESKKIDNYFL